jgi:hypothetical protein
VGKNPKSIVFGALFVLLVFLVCPHPCLAGKTLKSMVFVGFIGFKCFFGFPTGLPGGQDSEINVYLVLLVLLVFGFFRNGF